MFLLCRGAHVQVVTCINGVALMQTLHEHQ